MSEAAGNEKPTRTAVPTLFGGLKQWFSTLFKSRNGDSQLRETIEEIIVEIQENEDESEASTPISTDERMMLGNILKLRHLTTYDVMVPRADIVAVDINTPIKELVEVMSRAGHSRLPVFRETLDDVVGIVHIKDLLENTREQKPFNLADIVRKVLIVAPSMRVLDLLLEMRLSRVHLALVVDEFGGIDGLLTTEDLLEEIVGEIEDEHDVEEGPKLVERSDGLLAADARATVEEFEEMVGPILSDEEREEDIDTLGGLVFSLAGRVPTRGELIVHPSSGVCFEILEADPRRVKRLRVRQLPERTVAETADE
ncbi:hemolysin family protein [Pelagibius sp. Alg239-R121]|uniref:hemolysin family protein n=1 Tax=Pelagibius sp. Alg239-R121 TaxID=2993448 RepID=UPI0024A6CC82|nr:hemolysin family protein [Pelagibius sp. Alg239-R121]